MFLLMISSFILSLTLVSAENLYQQDSLELELDIQGSLILTAQSSSADVKQASAELWLYPQDSFRQKTISLDTEGEVQKNSLLFYWKNPEFGRKEYGYTAKIKTFNEKNKVTKKITYPLPDIQGYEQYTLPTGKIDSDNPEIIAKARELADGEEDLFKLVFNLASWISGNVNYDLNELTTNTAQKASWVLEHREGVCDEMTSLFVAMARSLGIPARFVSGISYTENQEVLQALGKNWAGHGWAEVYFPEIGWVSFDIAFDEFGYVDVTHIKLREGLDPDDPATTFEWLANGVNLTSQELNEEVKILNRGQFVPEAIQLDVETLATDIDFGSYNLIKGTVKNEENSYAAATLRLGVPEEIEVINENKKQLLLYPKEAREISWIVKVPDNLEENYQYEFPIILYSEKNITARRSFNVKKGSQFLSKEEIEEFFVRDEERAYSGYLDINCDYQREQQPGKENKFICKIKNEGEIGLEGLSYCLGKECETISLKAGEEKIRETFIVEDKPGWHYLIVHAENSEVEKKESFSFIVVDSANLSLELLLPEEVQFGEEVPATIVLDKRSFIPPRDIVIRLEGLGIVQTIEMEKLSAEQEFKVTFPGENLGFKNTIIASATWSSDSTGQKIEKKVSFAGKGNELNQKMKMILNSILNLLR